MPDEMGIGKDAKRIIGSAKELKDRMTVRYPE